MWTIGDLSFVKIASATGFTFRLSMFLTDTKSKFGLTFQIIYLNYHIELKFTLDKQ